MEIPKYNIFIGHGHLKHNWDAWELEGEGKNLHHLYPKTSDQRPIKYSISFRYDWSMEEVNGKIEAYKGFEEASLKEEGRKHSVQEEVSGDSSNGRGTDTFRAEQIPNDEQRVINWVTSILFIRYLVLHVAY